VDMQNQGSTPPTSSQDLSSNDRLFAALSYVFAPIVPIIVLVMEDTKNKHFPRYHAFQALGIAAGLIVGYIALMFVFICASIVSDALASLLGCVVSLAGLAVLGLEIYFAYNAYQGKYFEIPVVTDFMVKQGWITRP